MRGVQNPATGLGSFVRVGREAQGLSLRQAAIAWKIEKGHLSLIEAGLRSELQAGTLLKLSRGLGVTIDEILTAKETPRPVDANREDTKSRPRSGRRESGKRIATT